MVRVWILTKIFPYAKAHKTFGVFAIEDREVSASGEEQ